MSLRARLGLGAVAGLFLVGLIPATSDAGETMPRKGGVEPTYVYAATFNVTVNYGLRLDYGRQNGDTRKLSATVSGALPNVELQDRYAMVPRDGHRGTVRVEQATAESTGTRNDGEFVKRCNGSKATARGPAWMENVGKWGQWVAPFVSLQFPVTCSDSETGPETATYDLERIVADKWSTHGSPGDATIVYKVAGDYKSPTSEVDTPCPGSVEGSTVSCAYTVKGTVTLKRIAKIKPKNNASLSKGAKKATAKFMCLTKCKVDISITTLDGKVRITLVHLSPKPGKMINRTLPIPPKKRPAVKKSGGIAMQLNYSMAGLSYSEVRRVRL